MPVPLDQGRAACADPEYLPLVDAAADKPGGPAAWEMTQTLCNNCPVTEQCLTWAMTHPEYGVWAGTSPHARTKRGGASAAKTLAGRTHGQAG